MMINYTIQTKTEGLMRDLEDLRNKLFALEKEINDIIDHRDYDRTEDMFDMFYEMDSLKDQILHKSSLLDLLAKFIDRIN